VTFERPPGEPVAATRSARHAIDRRRRRLEAGVTVVVVVVVGAYAWFQAEASSPSVSSTPGATSRPTSTPGTGSGGPVEAPQLLALSVTGAQRPLLAIVGIGRGGGAPAIVAVPMGLTLVVPGAGEMRAKDVGVLRGSSVQVALSNMMGVWAGHYLVTDVDRLAVMVDAAGGLSTDLPQGFVLPTAVVGPGAVTLTGGQVKEMLVSTKGSEAPAAWRAVLGAWLAHPPALARTDVDQTDDLPGAGAVLEAARGAPVLVVPTKTVAGTAAVVDQPAFDTLVTKTFGTTEPVPVIVQNGSGRPGIGEAVARRILPAGFRVVISENASTFGVALTTITANGRKHVAQARSLRRDLGVGRVRLSRVPSGVGDITVVVGEDFRA
jgi:hypothetical protein